MCSRCGASIPDATKDTALCPECRAQAKRESVVRPRACRTCGKVFPGGPRAWYCPECRAERKREADRRQRERGRARKLGSIQICERCGKPYPLTGGRQRYCPDCAPDAVREAVAPKKREQARSYAHKNRRTLLSGVRRCVICGAPIVGERAKAATNTCSEACDAKRRRLRQREAVVKRGRKKP